MNLIEVGYHWGNVIPVFPEKGWCSWGLGCYGKATEEPHEQPGKGVLWPFRGEAKQQLRRYWDRYWTEYIIQICNTYSKIVAEWLESVIPIILNIGCGSHMDRTTAPRLQSHTTRHHSFFPGWGIGQTRMSNEGAVEIITPSLIRSYL